MKKCPEGKVVNPKTGRCVKACPDGSLPGAKAPKCPCPEGKIINPDTGRCVKKIPKKKTQVAPVDFKKLILDSLEKLKKQEVYNKQTWKVRAYTTVIKQIELVDKPIYTIDDLKDVSGIGKKIEAKIIEIIETGKLEALANYNASGKIKLSEELLKIHGIGPAKANDLINTHNIKSMQELKENLHLLNNVQKLGIIHYQDFNERIPRAEMIKHDSFIRTKIKSFDPKIRVELTGSYRRKLTDSGDIDVLVTHDDDPVNFTKIFKGLVKELMKDEYIIDTFALGTKKCMAVCKLKNHEKYRRIDILYTRKREFPFALLYFTGSQEFNIDMRNIALSKGYSLNEYELQGAKHNFETEQDIFDYLGLNYVEPENRRKNVLKAKV
jgi:DNA polymerase beta